jgi:hypothetical protein
MTHPSNRPVEIGLRAYRALAGAFPYEFKNAYGEELVQVAEDAIDEIWRRHGALGPARLRQDVHYGLRMLTAAAQQAGRTIPAGDGLIAATAHLHGLYLMTRNTADFEPSGVSLLNPWERQ